MNKRRLQDAVYSYLVLYKKGITVQDVLDNKDVFTVLTNGIDKKDRTICDVYLKFTYKNDLIFEIKSLNNKLVFQIDITNVDFDILTQLFFLQISCSNFLCRSSQLIGTLPPTFEIEKLIKESEGSWERFVDRIGYKEEDFFVSDESLISKKIIEEENILWCYNKSCTGKTFLGIYTLTYCNSVKLVYNPAVNNTCSLDLLKILIEYGTNFALLIDDLQCDVELAKTMLSFICNNKDDIKARVKNLSRSITCYISTTDPYVPNELSVDFSDKIGANKIFVEDAGHFNSAAGYTHFEQLLEEMVKNE